MPGPSNKIKKQEVEFSEADYVLVGPDDIDLLKSRAAKNERKRYRLCAHSSPADKMHEMFIVHKKGNYIRPHSHTNKSESIHVIEGEVDIVIFNQAGKLEAVHCLGSCAGGKDFFFRMNAEIFHTLLIKTPYLVFHESTSGPFDPVDTNFPSWAPEEGANDIDAYMSDLFERVEQFKFNGGGDESTIF